MSTDPLVPWVQGEIAAPPAPANRVLAALSGESLARIARVLEIVPLEVGHVLGAAGEVPRYVYFPEGGIISFTVEMQGGFAETGIIGREGVSCYTALRQGSVQAASAKVQIGGFSAYRIAANHFRRAVRQCPDLHDAVHDALFAFMGQIAQTAASNARHSLAMRMARWILLCDDRLDGGKISVTHELLARVLGSQRTSVTSTLHVLEGESAIRNSRGTIAVLDRRRLRQFAGEAYGS